MGGHLWLRAHVMSSGNSFGMRTGVVGRTFVHDSLVEKDRLKEPLVDHCIALYRPVLYCTAFSWVVQGGTQIRLLVRKDARQRTVFPFCSHSPQVSQGQTGSQLLIPYGTQTTPPVALLPGGRQARPVAVPTANKAIVSNPLVHHASLDVSQRVPIPGNL